MRKTETRKEIRTACKTEMNTYEPICDTLKKARMTAGISRSRLAARMGIPETTLAKYENGAIRIPTSMLLKLLIFGLDFWCEQDL